MKKTVVQKLKEGFAALNEGKFEIAERLYRSIVETQPTNSDAYNNLGITLLKLNKLEEAEINYKKAIDLKPNFALAYYNLGFTLHKLARFEEAKASYKKAIEFKSDYVLAHYNLAVMLVELNSFKEAEESYKNAIRFQHDFLFAHYNLGNMLSKLNRLDEAEIYFGKAIALKPDFKLALLNRGQILFEKGKFESSLKDFDACNNEDSRSRALTSLYALGKIEDIYHRIKKNSELDYENLQVAAFSSFITYKEKKETVNKFCINPINFINFSNLSFHLKDPNTFISEIIEELGNVDTSWEPSGKTTIKGFQSRPNLFINPVKKMQKLKTIIVNEIGSYKLKFKNEDCTYIKKFPPVKNISCWHVILKHQGHQNAHIHPGGWLSGVIYLKTIPSLGKNEGAIEFCLNGEHYSDVNSPKVIHQPKLGDIVLFPSSLHHRTIPFSTDTDRISIAFDLIPDSK